MYEPGTATRPHFIRLSEEDSDRCKIEAARLGIPLVELFRRMMIVYFEVLEATPEASTTLTPRQAKSLLDAAKPKREPDKFNLTGEGDN